MHIYMYTCLPIQAVMDATEREYLTVKNTPKVKKGSSTALLKDMAALGTSSEAIAVRQHFEREVCGM